MVVGIILWFGAVVDNIANFVALVRSCRCIVDLIANLRRTRASRLRSGVQFV